MMTSWMTLAIKMTSSRIATAMVVPRLMASTS
jgi:hypothetical protein